MLLSYIIFALIGCPVVNKSPEVTKLDGASGKVTEDSCTFSGREATAMVQLLDMSIEGTLLNGKATLKSKPDIPGANTPRDTFS